MKKQPKKSLVGSSAWVPIGTQGLPMWSMAEPVKDWICSWAWGVGLKAARVEVVEIVRAKRSKRKGGGK